MQLNIVAAMILFRLSSPVKSQQHKTISRFEWKKDLMWLAC
jgi:hypothetical protein